MRLKAALKDWRRRRLLRRAGIGVEIERPRFRAGARSGVWVVDPTDLDQDSVVYSFGIGDNLAWDLALIERFGCRVHAFDPTPRSVEWLQRQRLPERLVHHAIAVAGRDGVLTFASPRKSSDVNFRPLIGQRPGAMAGGFAASAQRVATIAGHLGHALIDVLKLDVEGGEYAVLDDLMAQGPPVRQLLVEFHHGEAGIGFDATQRAIASLRRAGYRIMDVSRRGLEFSFLHRRD